MKAAELLGFQSTLPRGERRKVALNPYTTDIVSIHAPTRGATKHRFPPMSQGFCFNPRSHEGSDPKAYIADSRSSGFNPRSHEGSDDHTNVRDIQRVGFNPRSHEGSDVIRDAVHAINAGFQSTLPRGERRRLSDTADARTWFQSTLPRGERRIDRSHVLKNLSFNPRSHEGSDGKWLRLDRCNAVSIHAPTRGATQQSGSLPAQQDVSIHAPTRGAT